MSTKDLFWVLGEQSLGPLELYFADALKNNGKNVTYINVHTIYKEYWKKIRAYSHRFPRKYDKLIQKKFFAIINNELIKRFNEDKPAHIFIYNDCLVLPETLIYFKNNGAKVSVFLGDDPNYLFPSKKTFLLNVMNADSVIVPDTGWIEGLKMLDVKNIIFSPVGTDTDVFFKMNPDQAQINKFESDILFIGTGYYLNSWGIKRASFLNELCDMNLKIFGDKLWEDLFPYFPDLRKHFKREFVNAKDVNVACNCSRIYPVIVNNGVVNGVSTRVFDCIASEIFVLAEYKKDFNIIFPDNEVITFKSKKELKDKTLYFLKNEKEMKEHIFAAKETLQRSYTLDILVKNILQQI